MSLLAGCKWQCDGYILLDACGGYIQLDATSLLLRANLRGGPFLTWHLASDCQQFATFQFCYQIVAQALALNAVAAGQHTVVCTATASGKSLCYNLPVLEGLAAHPRATALYLFPTKALAQDQLRVLRELCAVAFGADAPGVEVRQCKSCLKSPSRRMPNFRLWAA